MSTEASIPPLEVHSPWLSGNFAPITMECDEPCLRVIGELPRELRGTLYRNGPNPRFMPSDPMRYHWFTGDGMVHAFSLENGRASHSNRWVRTAKWRAEAIAGRPLTSGYSAVSIGGTGIADEGVANTNVVWHAGHLLALEEGHAPIELDPATLETRGVRTFGGAVSGPFTAHPKIDPITGEMIFFGYSTSGPFSPTMTFGVVGADGCVKRYERFEAPYCSMVHDFIVTRRQVIFPVLPISGSVTRQAAGLSPYAWEPALGSWLGVMPREQGVGSLRWFPVENRYVYHVLNAWDDGARIVADVMEYEHPSLFPNADGSPATGDSRAHLTRWTIDQASDTDTVTYARLDDMPGEFPRIDDRRAGLRHRFGAFAGRSQPEAAFDSVVWHDFVAQRRSVFSLPAGDGVSEPVFVPRQEDAEEGAGWLLVTAWRAAEQRSDLLVFDTDAVERGPVATVQLSDRVPFGFHGNWVPATA